jgi:hypothetical protein
MNERIIELAEQAGFENGHQDRYGNSLSQELEQFAELIVGECAGIYDKIDNGNLHMGTDNYLEALHKTFRS